MANHRPKSLNELNQVYDKAMKAERAIKEGSKKLSEPQSPAERPSDNIFEQLQRQAASKPAKAELYDSEIANIANDFIKRYTQSEKKAESATAPKEIKRPAPSIQSLYHSPVKDTEPKHTDVPLSTELPFMSTAPVAGLTRPKAPEALNKPDAVKAPDFQHESPAVPEIETVPEPSAAEAPAPRTAIEQSQHEAYTAPHRVAPTVRITSTERSNLMDEYLRVMSDEDDDMPFGRKHKKLSFFGRRKKHRDEEDELYSDSFTENISTADEEIAEEIPVASFDSSSAETSYNIDDEYPAEEESEELPMNLYDYIEADFDYEEDGDTDDENSSDVPLAEDLLYDEPSTEEVETEEFEAEEDSLYQEEIASRESEAESDTASQDGENEEIAYTSEEETVVYPVETEEAELSDETEEETVYPTEEAREEEEIIFPTETEEEADLPAEEEVVYPTETKEDTDNSETEEELSPTAGMVFDDIFSVTDENKRSYTGGNWADAFGSETVFKASEEKDAKTEEDSFEEEYSSQEEQTDEETSLPEKRKKSGAVSKIFLSLSLIILIACCALTASLGSVIGVNTGKVFGEKYRAFTAEQDFVYCGVSAGDLVISEDVYAEEDDNFVYVNHEAQRFVLGKHVGSTYSITGDVLFIAENEGGRTLVAREDTLGVITATYEGIGGIIGIISENYIAITAVLLVLCLAVLLALIIPRSKSGSSKKASELKEEASAEYEEDAGTTEDSEDAEDNEDDIDYDLDYDTDGIEEGLFSGI